MPVSSNSNSVTIIHRHKYIQLSVDNSLCLYSSVDGDVNQKHEGGKTKKKKKKVLCIDIHIHKT